MIDDRDQIICFKISLQVYQYRFSALKGFNGALKIFQNCITGKYVHLVY